MSYRGELKLEPWRFDFLSVMRELERTYPDKPRVGDSTVMAEDVVALGQDPYLEFPASSLSRSDRDLQGRLRVLVKFLGLLGQIAVLTAELERALEVARRTGPFSLEVADHA